MKAAKVSNIWIKDKKIMSKLMLPLLRNFKHILLCLLITLFQLWQVNASAEESKDSPIVGHSTLSQVINSFGNPTAIRNIEDGKILIIYKEYEVNSNNQNKASANAWGLTFNSNQVLENLALIRY